MVMTRPADRDECERAFDRAYPGFAGDPVFRKQLGLFRAGYRAALERAAVECTRAVECDCMRDHEDRHELTCLLGFSIEKAAAIRALDA